MTAFGLDRKYKLIAIYESKWAAQRTGQLRTAEFASKCSGSNGPQSDPQSHCRSAEAQHHHSHTSLFALLKHTPISPYNVNMKQPHEEYSSEISLIDFVCSAECQIGFNEALLDCADVQTDRNWHLSGKWEAKSSQEQTSTFLVLAKSPLACKGGPKSRPSAAEANQIGHAGAYFVPSVPRLHCQEKLCDWLILQGVPSFASPFLPSPCRLPALLDLDAPLLRIPAFASAGAIWCPGGLTSGSSLSTDRRISP